MSEEILKKIEDFVVNFKRGKSLFLYGPVGSGKTYSVYEIAKKLRKEVFELNASDARNKKAIEELLGNAVKQESLFSFGKGKIILCDEIDGLSGTKDRGAGGALAKLIKESSFPVILTGQDPFVKKLKDVKKTSILLELPPKTNEEIIKILENECKKRNVIVNEGIKQIARNSGGDVRAAINDLIMASTSGELDASFISERDQTETMEQALTKVFKTKDLEIAKTAFYTVPEMPDICLRWVDENLPNEYENEDLERAYEHLSRADVFLGRIRRWQYWRFLVYISAHISVGVALSKKEKYKKIPNYKEPRRGLQLWILKMKYHKREEIARKIAKECHTSIKRVIPDILPSVQKMIKQGKNFPEFDFSEEELTWLKG